MSAPVLPKLKRHERMRPIPGYPGYAVTCYGRVFSNKRGSWKELSPTPDGGGYLQFSLTDDNGCRVMRKVHRMVLIAFRGPCPKDHEGCHRNGNRQDNKVRNLRWGTKVSNAQDTIKHGTHVGFQRGENHPRTKLTRELVRCIRNEYAPYIVTRQMLADKYKVSTGCIKNIVERKVWI